MNGLSLLVALATVGVEVGWEQGPDQQQVYTFRIEASLLETLRGPDAVQGPIHQQDRGIRRFQVAMGRSSQSERATQPMANEVTYGWGPNKKNPRELDYYVQLTPERLETLGKGIPVQCEVHPSVPEIHHIYVFRGVQQLPRELPENMKASPSTTRTLGGADGLVRPATNAVTQASNTDSRFGTPDRGDSRFAGGSTARSTIGDGSTDRRTLAPDDGWEQENRNRRTNSSAFGPDPPPNYQTQAGVRNDYDDRLRKRMIDVPGLSEAQGQQSLYQSPYRYADDRMALRTETGRQPIAPAQTSAANDETTKQLLALVQSQQEMVKELKQQQAGAANQVIPGGYNAALASQQNPNKSDAEASSEGLRTPLVVTMLALFASLCANAYIGWLAWSFFWRFRNAASDLARAQTAATMRQAA